MHLNDSFEELFSDSFPVLSEAQKSSISQRQVDSLMKWKTLPLAPLKDGVDGDTDVSRKSHRRPRKFYAQSMIEINTSMLGETRFK